MDAKSYNKKKSTELFSAMRKEESEDSPSKPTASALSRSAPREERSVSERFQQIPWDGARPEAVAETAAPEKVGSVRDRFRHIPWEPGAIADQAEQMSDEEIREEAGNYSEQKTVKSVFAKMK